MNLVVKPSDKALIRRLIVQVGARLKHLEPGNTYTLGSILGKDFWDDEDDSHLALGHAFSALEREGRVPFNFVRLTSDRHNLYRYEG